MNQNPILGIIIEYRSGKCQIPLFKKDYHREHVGKVFLSIRIRSLAMWLIGFFLHEMAFGLLSIFVPLYITQTVGGSLLDFGIMTSLAAFLAIPFSFFWGYLSDKMRRYKLFILISFSTITALLYVFSLITNITMLILLYAIIAILHIAHEPPKNVLIAENYSSQDWEKNFAWYELLTQIGWSIGLIFGFLMSTQAFSGAVILTFCAALNLAAFVASAIFITDPPLVFERGLVSMERTLGFAQRGISLALKASEGGIVDGKLRRESSAAFCFGLVLFSLATSILFTPLPVFFSNELALSSSVVFAVFVMNSGGDCVGYFIAMKAASLSNKARTVRTTTAFRGLLPLLMLTAIFNKSTATIIIAVIVLILMGFAYALFLTSTLSLSMEILQEGKAGLFNALIGLGGAFGCLVGPLLATSLGFPHVFITSSAIFIMSYIAFKVFA